MRAIGFAALSFGAVIALSATLGMSYRSDASPLDDPSASASTSTSASDTGTPAVSDSSSAADPTAPTDNATSPSPTDDATTPAAADPSTPAAADSPTPTDDPSPPDLPAPSFHTFGVQALDVLPPVSYDFAPSQVTATINDDTADGGQVQLNQHIGTDWVTSGAPVDVTGPGQTITFGSLDTGTWNLTTTDLYGGQVDFHQFTIQNAPAITSLTWGSTVELRGTATTFVPGSVLVYRTDGSDPGQVVCTSDATINTSTGAWACDFPAPTDIGTDLGVNYATAVYQVVEQDYTGGTTALSGAVSYNPAYISSFSFDAPNSVTANGFDPSGNADSGSIAYQAANADGSTTGSPQAMTDLGEGGSCSNIPSRAEPLDCKADFGTGRTSGLWAITTRQTEGSYPEVADPARYVFIPPAPTLHFYTGEGTEFFGTGLVDDIVTVSDSEGTDVCTARVGPVGGSENPIGIWSCSTGEFNSALTYTATQADAGNLSVDGVGPGVSIVAGGVSLAAPVTPAPSVAVDQELRPAGVSVTGHQGDGSAGTSISFYHYAADDGGSGPVAWYGYAQDSWCPIGEGGPVQGANTCELTGLAPGDYESYVYDSGFASAFDSWWVVPETPVITSTVLHANRTVTLKGTGVTGDAVRVIVDGASPACNGTIVSGGTWTCLVPALTAGHTHTFQSYLQDVGRGDPVIFGNGDNDGATYTSGGISAASATTSVTISGTAETPAPTATVFPDWFFSITGVDLNNVHPGDQFTVTGSGLPPGSTVSGELHSKAVSIGSALVQPDGTFSLPVTVPADFPAGAHTIVMTLTPPGSTAVASQQPLKVVPASDTSSAGDTPTPSDSPSPLGSSEGPGIDHHGPNSNILTHGLNSIADVLAHPAKVASAIEIGLVLLIFAVLPGHLLNATLAEQYERFTKRRSQRRKGPSRWARLVAFLHRAPFVAGLLLTTATALLFGFADPRFGFSLASLRLFLGLAIALAVVSYLTNAVVGRLMRGRWKVDVEVSLRPLGLILTVVGVVVSRVLDFSPGFLIGLVLGLVISEKHLAKQAWRAVLLRSSILLGLALLAWFAFSLFDAKEEGGTFASELAVETLVAITTEAVVGLLVELLPLKLLEGEKLYEKSKVLWGALYLLAVFIFVVAVVPWEGNWAELGTSLWAWIGIVVGFGIVATGIYLYFRIRGHEEHEEHKVTDEDEEHLVPIGSEDE